MCLCLHGMYVVGMVIFDTPYGVTEEDWDIPLTMADLDRICKQICAAQQTDYYPFFLFHNPIHSHLVKTALEQNGFSEVQHFFWHKSNHSSQTPVSSYTNSVEMGSIGFYGGKVKCRWKISTDPHKRHNFIDVESVKACTKINGEIVNSEIHAKNHLKLPER